MEIVDINDEISTSIVIGDQSPVEIIDTTNELIEVIEDTEENTVVVEVMQGLPGAQNLYVGYTPPDNPQEGWVWIDLNG